MNDNRFCLYCGHLKDWHYYPHWKEWPRLIRCTGCPEGLCKTR